MTGGTDDEYNDLYKIDINLENDEDNHRKWFFENGLSALLDNPHFLLLYVPSNDVKMQIIQPASEHHHHKRIIERINAAKCIPSFYYALSHLWGISKENRHLWYDISNYVDDENGQPAAPVSMRPEKRDTLLALLKSHPDSYWWIDVLCARTETPLDIMGDIYACCLGCYAMIDCEPSIMSQLSTKQIESTILDDPARKFYDTRDLNILTPYEQYYVKECPQIIDLLSTLIASEWWKRVWTWQEMTLPVGDVYLVAETTTNACRDETIVLEDIRQLTAVMLVLYDAFRVINASVEFERIDHLWDWAAGIVAARRCNNARIERKKDAHFIYMLILLLGRSTRRCMDPVDYVYGVLGLFQFKIPRMTDPHAVWQIFLSELKSYLEDIKNESFPVANMDTNTAYRTYKEKITGIDDRAQQVNLLTAQSMTDVYQDLITTILVDDE